MKILLNATFEKQYEKLPKKIQDRFNERLILFQRNPQDLSLNIHKLQGKKKASRKHECDGKLSCALFTRKWGNHHIL